MNTEEWSALKSWFNTTGRKSPEIPADAKNAIETLIEERENEGDDDDDEGGEED